MSIVADPQHGALVLTTDDLPVLDRGNGITTTRLVTAARGSRAMLNGITRIAPGAEVPLHTHNCEESAHVLSGTGTVRIGETDYPVAMGATHWVPADVPHCFRNIAGAEPLVIFWTYTSIDATRTIVATGITTRIDAE